MRRTTAAIAAVFFSLSSIMPAFALNLSDQLHANDTATHVDMNVACGKLDKSNCAQVLPRIAEQIAAFNVGLNPAESDGSLDSAKAVCQGLVPAAIVQRDAADFAARKCPGKIEGVGKALYPYYGFLVIRADAPYDTLEKLVRHLPAGKTLNIAVGTSGSGGAVTMGYILDSNSEWKRAITMQYQDDTALQELRDGNIDGFFIMDAPGSPKIEKIKEETDAKGHPVFQFADVRPGDAFYSIKDWSGKNLFQEETVIHGFFRDTRSVSVDAVVIVGRAFHDDRAHSGPKTVEALGVAIDKAVGTIRTDTKAPKDWQPAAFRR